jgi:hypothetical protein
MDGVFIFDIISPLQDEQTRHRAKQQTNSPTSCIAVEGSQNKIPTVSTWRSFWNPVTKLSTVVISFLMRRTDGQYGRKREVHVQRWYPLSSIRSLLASAGLTVRGFHNADDFGPVTRETSWIKFIAQKRTTPPASFRTDRKSS